MGVGLQATTWEGDTRSHYAPLKQFCKDSGFTHITPTDTHTFIPAKTHLDHWLLRHQSEPALYTTHNTLTTYYTLEYGDYKALILGLSKIGDIQLHNAKRAHTNPSTRSHPPFIIPIPQYLVDLYRLGKDSIKTKTTSTSHTITTLLHDDNATANQIGFATAHVRHDNYPRIQ